MSEEGQRELDERSREAGNAWRRRSFFCQLKAEALAYAGDPEGALTAMEQADVARLIDVSWLDHCPLLDALRSDARFRAVRLRVGSRADEVRHAFGADARR